MTTSEHLYYMGVLIEFCDKCGAAVCEDCGECINPDCSENNHYGEEDNWVCEYKMGQWKDR